MQLSGIFSLDYFILPKDTYLGIGTGSLRKIE